MSVAIRTATRIQDQDDVNVTVGAGVDGYALTWDNASAKFVLAAAAGGVSDHGALTGLSDDDHSDYARLTGRAGGQTLYGGTAANDDITIHGTSNATRTTSYVILQPTAGNVGIGTSAPATKLHILGAPNTTVATFDAGGGGDKVDITTNGGLRITANGNYNTGPAWQFWPTGTVYQGMYFDAGSSTGVDLFFRVSPGGVTALVIKQGTGLVGIGTTYPTTLLHTLLASAATNAVTNVVTIGHDTTGTAAAGFGAGLLFALESSTTAAQNAARVQALWYEATHATRKADLVGTAYDAGGEREGWRIRGAGSAAAIGFYGVTPIVRATLATGAGAAVDDVITALQNLGLVKQS